MATAPVTPAPKQNAFVRFIDAIGHFFVKSAPVIEKVAVDLEPALAFTPFGPEYDLVVNAVVGSAKTAAASVVAGTTLTGAQKMQLVLQAVTPGLDAILKSKGVTDQTAIDAAIAQWSQVVFDILAGPVAATPAAPAA
jgi:hypothetical protein